MQICNQFNIHEKLFEKELIFRSMGSHKTFEKVSGGFTELIKNVKQMLKSDFAVVVSKVVLFHRQNKKSENF